ncbi:MAG: SpoIIE family protein phosphatase [Nocardioides sp.]
MSEIGHNDGIAMSDVLSQAGPVGLDLMLVDWAATPVGHPDSWSLSLRSAVRIMLTSKFAMWLAWGPDLTFFCNDAYRRDTLGSKYPWALGRPASEVWSEIWQDIGPRIDEVMATGEATWDEALMLFLERSGYVEETYHTFSYSPLADDDGSISGMLCVVAEVTEQVISERRMRTLRDLGVGVRTARNEQAAVQAACALLAQNPASLPFAAVYLFDAVSGDAQLVGTAGGVEDHPSFPGVIGAREDRWGALAARSGRVSVFEGPDQLPDGLPMGAWQQSPHQTIVVPVAGPTGQDPYGFLIVGINPFCPLDDAYRDFIDLLATHLSGAVTGARALEDQRQRAERLAALDQAKSDFLANVSHELRTPLTLLLGPAEDALADHQALLPDAQRRRVEMVTRNGQRMLALVNALLESSRLQAGQDDAHFVPTDLGHYTAELVSMFESAAQRAGLTFEIRCAEEVRAFVDREFWSTIVVNLVSNALKFTFEGGVVVEVTHGGGHARLEVRDTGTGVADDDLPLLFDRFHRVSGAKSRTHEGSGIGLALVDQLAQAHGGQVSVMSSLGVGTSFVVTVPLGSQHLPQERVGDNAENQDGVLRRQMKRVSTDVSSWDVATPGAGDTSTALIQVETARDNRAEASLVLVVDDNADMRDYVADLLRGDGYDVAAADDGVLALELLRTTAVDLVLSDVMMPHLDGFGLLRAIRSDPTLSAMPVIMLSARAGEEGLLEGLDMGADDYLIKPFSARELLARVRTHLSVNRAEQVRRVLEQSKELLDQAQQLAKLGSWEIDVDTGVVTASDTCVEMLGLTHKELTVLGSEALMSRLVHPDDLESVEASLAGLAAGERISYDTRVVLASGEERLVAVHAQRAGPDDGAGHVLRGSLQDITEQRRAQGQLIAAEALQEATARERAIADELQRSLLPPLSFDVEALEVATHYRAGAEGTQVGGDWYDVIDLGAGRSMLVMGDVMGRGVRAAAVTGQLRAAVRALAFVDLSPAEILEQLDDLVQDLEQEQIVTCVLGVVDVGDMSFTYASAGHLPMIVTRNAGTKMLEGTGPPLGAGFYGVENVRVAVEPGDVLALYTDGLIEQRGSDLLDDINDLALRLCEVHDRAVQDQIEVLVGAAAERGDVVADDVAVLLVRIRAHEGGAVLRRRLDHSEHAPAVAREAISAHLLTCGVPAGVRDDVVLAVSELVTNAVLYASPPLSLRVACADQSVLVEVVDRTSLRPRRQRPTDDDEHGRGLNIVAAVTSSWGTRRAGAGKAVWCTFTW